MKIDKGECFAGLFFTWKLKINLSRLGFAQMSGSCVQILNTNWSYLQLNHILCQIFKLKGLFFLVCGFHILCMHIYTFLNDFSTKGFIHEVNDMSALCWWWILFKLIIFWDAARAKVFDSYSMPTISAIHTHFICGHLFAAFTIRCMPKWCVSLDAQQCD